MKERHYRSSPVSRQKSCKGHSNKLDIRIDTAQYPEVIELLKTRSREEFEKKYNMRFTDEDIPEGKDDIPWKGFKNRVVAILGHIARRKEGSCSDDISLH